MWFVFTTLVNARAFVASCDAALGLPLPGVPPTPTLEDGSPGYGWTRTWADPVPHPDGTQWAVPMPDGVLIDAPAGGTLVQELDASWVVVKGGY